jgi:NADPH-dependent 2,4-dienoyl-CoA reductase/sulfur reductase-like enzyme
MSQESEHEATAEIIAATEGSASPNGFGATVDEGPGLAANPIVLVAAAFVGGFLLARVARRRGG